MTTRTPNYVLRITDLAGRNSYSRTYGRLIAARKAAKLAARHVDVAEVAIISECVFDNGHLREWRLVEAAPGRATKVVYHCRACGCPRERAEGGCEFCGATGYRVTTH